MHGGAVDPQQIDPLDYPGNDREDDEEKTIKYFKSKVKHKRNYENELRQELLCTQGKNDKDLLDMKWKSEIKAQINEIMQKKEKFVMEKQ
uniref:Uncharacterized protein n=1 Tax=Romanomermis culicivorax TaxID=13658 RepID=A0A915ICC3_ROMCU